MAALNPQAGGCYLDGTLGLGGHSGAILERAPQSQVCGLDQDCEALALARQRLASYGERIHFSHLRFAEFAGALRLLSWPKLNGAILDLGVSSLQLDQPERGFSFRSKGPLDMRMDPSSISARAWDMVNRASHAELRDCFATLGEDPQAGRIARFIIEERQKQPINDTARLAEIICNAYPPAWRRSARRHPATRAFQALRMAVNDELGQLRLFLDRIWSWIVPGGRLVIISFHSLEDRLVKISMRERSLPRDNPEIQVLYKKPLCPDQTEISANPRSASAKLRAAEKLREAV